jgi:FAD/FMN-containing dehydrogenase
MNKISIILNWIAKLLIKLFYGSVSVVKKAFRFIHKRKFLAIPFYGFLLFVFYLFILIKISGDTSFDYTLTNNRINDVTQLNPIQVNKIIKPTKPAEIKKALLSTTGPVSIGGGKYSMGGQTAFENSLHIDMRSFNQILDFNKKEKTITVQPGITWRAIQDYIDQHNLSVKIMQTYANFTVGGSISVNCHGRYIGHGPIISSVREIKIMTIDGTKITANRNQNTEIFNAAIGGYGGIGVLIEATLDLEENTKVERHAQKISAKEYNAFFKENIAENAEVIFQNGDLYPPNYDQVMNISWHVSEKELTEEDRLRPRDESYWLEQRLVGLVAWGDFGKWVRRSMIDPLYYRSEKVVWRNNEASYNVLELEPKSREKSTYVLQEYFIPVDNINSFIPKMKAVYEKYNVNVINVSLRHAKPDEESYLSWAIEEVFAFVIYYKQKTTAEAKENVRQWTVEMTDAILSENGSWYLPYQPHATVEQFNQAYPNAGKYFALKDSLDNDHRFTNKLLDKYNPYLATSLSQKKKEITGYYKPEEQTILTVPEWYLVFNPKEYADYLAEGNNPSAFPFYKSIDEYWKLYDRSTKLTSEAYPSNPEYLTMLQVIGVSVTMEYSVKMIYENTIGWFFSLFSEENISGKENVINAAHRAYSNFIYHTAWYEFEFLPWIGRVWSADEEGESSFLRRWERTLFFTLEFSFKAFYAQLIEWAATASYEPPIQEIYLEANSPSPIMNDADARVLFEQDSSYLIGVTRWGVFTEKMVEFSKDSLSITDISGNDAIVVSILGPVNDVIEYPHVQLLYNSAIVTQPEMLRRVVLVPVVDLLPFVRYCTKNGYEVEHVYDF